MPPVTNSSTLPLRRALARARARAVVTLVPDKDVRLLRTHANESGYRNVYRHHHGWVAKVKENGVYLPIPGSRSQHPHQAAAFVVAYYRVRYGADWADALRERGRLYWRVHWCGPLGGFVLRVWSGGKPRHVRDDRGECRVFATRRAAVDAARALRPAGRPNWRPGGGSPVAG